MTDKNSELKTDILYRDIEELALDDPIVKAGLDMYKEDTHLAWTKILMMMVYHLSKQNTDLMIQLLTLKVEEITKNDG